MMLNEENTASKIVVLDDENERPNRYIDLDGYLNLINGFGKFQLIHLVSLSLMVAPLVYQVLLSNYTAHSPSWKCVFTNSTISSCNKTGTFSVGDSYYDKRCLLPRSDWEYTTKISFSIATKVK